MTQTLLTTDQITFKALQLFRNSNALLRAVNRQYDSSFAVTGAKIGATLRVRLPFDPVVRSGAPASIQDLTEKNTTITVASQKGVDIAFTSNEKALSLDDYVDRVLSPAINNLGGAVASDLTDETDARAKMSNLVARVDGSGVILSPTADTWLQAGAVLDQMSCPRAGRHIVMDPMTQARTVSSMAGLFNPQVRISENFVRGQMTSDTLGFDTWNMDQSVVRHTSGTFDSGAAVGPASQSGTAITIGALAGGKSINIGDIITFDGVYSVNRVNKKSNSTLAQFCVTAHVAAGDTVIHIYPALTPPVGGFSVEYQTVTASPGSGAGVNYATNADAIYRKNFAFHDSAITLVTADLFLPTAGVISASRKAFDGISMRVIEAYLPSTDQAFTRLDILYGYAYLRPEWICAIADAV